MKYKVNEIFYSIQGEGLYTGTPMIFIRMAGCNENCHFCDTNHEHLYTFTEQELIHALDTINTDCRRVCITGGEPTLQDLRPLVNALQNTHFYVHLETNGTGELFDWIDWITVSPKHSDLHQTVPLADEMKYLYGDQFAVWAQLIVDVEAKYPVSNTLKYIQPIDGARSAYNTEHAIKFCKQHPEFRLSIQTHKILKVR